MNRKYFFYSVKL